MLAERWPGGGGFARFLDYGFPVADAIETSRMGFLIDFDLVFRFRLGFYMKIVPVNQGFPQSAAPSQSCSSCSALPLSITPPAGNAGNPV